jgi:hypothetical protein
MLSQLGCDLTASNHPLERFLPPDRFLPLERFVPERFLPLERFRPPDFRGTFAPFFLASESPIAIACLRLFTLLPLLPDLRVPFLRRFIALSTRFDADFPYLLPPEDFLAAIRIASETNGGRLYLRTGGACCARKGVVPKPFSTSFLI